MLSKNLYSRLRNHPETLARMHEDASLQDTRLVVSCNHAHSAIVFLSFILRVCVLLSQPINLRSEKCPGCVRPTALEIHLLTRSSRRKKLGRGFRSITKPSLWRIFCLALQAEVIVQQSGYLLRQSFDQRSPVLVLQRYLNW